MKKLIQVFGICCSYIYSLNLSYVFSDISKHLYTGLKKRFFREWGENSVLQFRSQQLIGLEYIKVGKDCTFGKNMKLTAWSSLNGQKFSPSITIGDGCVIGSNAHITAINSIIIGNKVLTGNNILITDNSHGSGTNKEMNQIPMNRPLISKGAVVIEDNVWLGDNVCILSGVTIGRGAIIGANSVVTHSIPPYSIAAGTPAKIIKSLICETTSNKEV